MNNRNGSSDKRPESRKTAQSVDSRDGASIQQAAGNTMVCETLDSPTNTFDPLGRHLESQPKSGSIARNIMTITDASGQQAIIPLESFSQMLPNQGLFNQGSSQSLPPQQSKPITERNCPIISFIVIQ